MPKAQPQKSPSTPSNSKFHRASIHDPPANAFPAGGRSANLHGAPPRFADPKVRMELIEAMRLGLPYHKVASICGIQVGTLKLWFEEASHCLQLYDQMLSENGGVEPNLTERQMAYAKLGMDLKRAEAEAERRCLQVIRDCAIGQDVLHEQVDTFDGKGQLVYSKKFSKERGKSWAAAAWYLERRHPEEYGKKRMLAEGELPPGIDLDTLRLAALLKQLPKVELEQVRQVVKSALTPQLANPATYDPTGQTTMDSPVVPSACPDQGPTFTAYEDQANPTQVSEPTDGNLPGWSEPENFPCCEHPSETGDQPSQTLDAKMVRPTANVTEAINPARRTQLGENVSSMGRPAELITRAKPANTLAPRLSGRNKPFINAKPVPPGTQLGENVSSMGSSEKSGHFYNFLRKSKAGHSNAVIEAKPVPSGTQLGETASSMGNWRSEPTQLANDQAKPILRVRRKP